MFIFTSVSLTCDFRLSTADNWTAHLIVFKKFLLVCFLLCWTISYALMYAFSCIKLISYGLTIWLRLFVRATDDHSLLFRVVSCDCLVEWLFSHTRDLTNKKLMGHFVEFCFCVHFSLLTGALFLLKSYLAQSK